MPLSLVVVEESDRNEARIRLEQHSLHEHDAQVARAEDQYPLGARAVVAAALSGRAPYIAWSAGQQQRKGKRQHGHAARQAGRMHEDQPGEGHDEHGRQRVRQAERLVEAAKRVPAAVQREAIADCHGRGRDDGRTRDNSRAVGARHIEIEARRECQEYRDKAADCVGSGVHRRTHGARERGRRGAKKDHLHTF